MLLPRVDGFCFRFIHRSILPLLLMMSHFQGEARTFRVAGSTAGGGSPGKQLDLQVPYDLPPTPYSKGGKK